MGWSRPGWRINSVVWILFACMSIPRISALATDEITSEECHRRTNQPCTVADYGPYSGMFVVDTGCCASVAHESSRFQLTPDATWTFMETDVHFLVGSRTATVIENIPVAAFGRGGQRTRLLLLEKPARSPAFLGVDGILGLPELCDFAVRIDLRNQLVTTLDMPWEPADGSIKAKLQPARNDVRAAVKIASTAETPLIVDTGFRGFLLLRSSALQLHQRLGDAVPANKVTISTAAEIREVQTYILKSVTICGFKFLDVPVLEANFNAIGMGCFSHFNMVLDFPNNEMWLAPHSNDWPKRVPPDASGLVLGFLDTNVLTLLRLQPDSAASKP